MGGAQIFLVALLSTAVSVQGLQFAPRSNCQALCSDGTGADAAKTNTSDVVCEDDDFADSGKGIKFKNCISCLQDSDFVSDSGSDVHAFLCTFVYSGDRPRRSH